MGILSNVKGYDVDDHEREIYDLTLQYLSEIKANNESCAGGGFPGFTSCCPGAALTYRTYTAYLHYILTLHTYTTIVY